MQVLRYCTAALLAIAAGALVGAQRPAPQPAGPAPGEATFNVFLRGTDVGREQVMLSRSGSQWILSSTGKLGDVTINRFEVKYTADWHPVEMRVEATQTAKEGQKKYLLTTSFAVTSAINEITQNGMTNSRTDQISARTIVLPTNVFAGYEVLAARLKNSDVGAELPTYIPLGGEVKVTVKAVSDESISTPAGIVNTRKFELAVQNPKAPMAMTVAVDDRGRLARLEASSTGLTIIRSDLAGVAARTLTSRNPTDADVTIPANGFSIAGTVTKPAMAGAGRLRLPTVVLVGGPGPLDRDSAIAGIPILSQIAGALSDQGFLVLRYDKRGTGQTGGRTESATQKDYADDLIAVVKWLDNRDDVDPRRIAVVGHSEGAVIGMLAASREKKIDALVLMAATGTTGADLILEQQQRELDRLKLPDDERAQRIALQKQIQAAVISGTGWDALPDDVRKQADSPWFRSLLMFDPAEVMPRVKQPILIVQGDLDTQVQPHNADRLAELARARKKDAGPVEVVHLPGINHLLVPATTGDVQEYPQLKDTAVSPEVVSAIASWLKKLA